MNLTHLWQITKQLDYRQSDDELIETVDNPIIILVAPTEQESLFKNRATILVSSVR